LIGVKLLSGTTDLLPLNLGVLVANEDLLVGYLTTLCQTDEM
jgi:hypothetical protein